MFVLEEEDGSIVEGFTPDFYLPQADVYLECTTAKQSLTTRKNGKIRKLRARGEVVAVHYRRDLERLLLRYGRSRLHLDRRLPGPVRLAGRPGDVSRQRRSGCPAGCDRSRDR
jgi:hypoxanthine phosphoribosyltransferase